MKPHHSRLGRASKMGGKDYPKTMDERESAQTTWWNLCAEAWAEEDPIKFLEVTMRITKFLARKQQRLDAAYDEAQRAERGNTLN
jgi:hypothetical protein